MSAYDHASSMHAEASGWDPRVTAFEMVRRRIAKVDHDRARNGLPRLVDADMTVEQRANAIRFILSGPQDPESVAAAAAQAVVLLMWLLKVEDASPHLGDAA